MFRILVAEDDKNLNKLIREYLEDEGYTVLAASDGREALDILDHEHIDLMVCDIMMPGVDGFALIADLRGAGYDLPILIITARDSMEDKRKGFELGTDDYMVKPIDFGEMLMRVSALLRRAGIRNDRKLSVGEVVLDYDSLTVHRGGQETELPKKEFLLLYKLLSYPKKIFTRQQLMDEIWGMDSETDERTVDVHVRHLREKFEDFSEFSIITVRGLGYKAEKYE